MKDLNLTSEQAIKFIRKNKGKIFADVITFGGQDTIRVAVEKQDLIATLKNCGESDSILIFRDDFGNVVLG